MKNVTDCQITTVQLHVVVFSIVCLIFSQFQSGVAYKSVAYKKKHVMQQYNKNVNQKRL